MCWMPVAIPGPQDLTDNTATRCCVERPNHLHLPMTHPSQTDLHYPHGITHHSTAASRFSTELISPALAYRYIIFIWKYWKQVKFQLWANHFICSMPAANDAPYDLKDIQKHLFVNTFHIWYILMYHWNCTTCKSHFLHMTCIFLECDFMHTSPMAGHRLMMLLL